MDVIATAQEIIVSLAIPADEYLRVYQGSAKKVSTLDSHGRRIQFPVNILQPYVTREGVYGVFAINFDQNHRFQSIRRLR